MEGSMGLALKNYKSRLKRVGLGNIEADIYHSLIFSNNNFSDADDCEQCCAKCFVPEILKHSQVRLEPLPQVSTSMKALKRLTKVRKLSQKNVTRLAALESKDNILSVRCTICNNKELHRVKKPISQLMNEKLLHSEAKVIVDNSGKKKTKKEINAGLIIPEELQCSMNKKRKQSDEMQPRLIKRKDAKTSESRTNPKSCAEEVKPINSAKPISSTSTKKKKIVNSSISDPVKIKQNKTMQIRKATDLLKGFNSKLSSELESKNLASFMTSLM